MLIKLSNKSNEDLSTGRLLASDGHTMLRARLSFNNIASYWFIGVSDDGWFLVSAKRNMRDENIFKVNYVWVEV